jgi:hypothetical protein
MFKSFKKFLGESRAWREKTGYIPPRWKQRIPEIQDHEIEAVKENLRSATGKNGDNLRTMSLATQARVGNSMPEDVAQNYNLDNLLHARPLDEGEKPYFKYLYNQMHLAIKRKNEAEGKKDAIGYREAKVHLHGVLGEIEEHFGKAISKHVSRSDPAGQQYISDLTSSDPKVKKQMTDKFHAAVRASIKK